MTDLKPDDRFEASLTTEGRYRLLVASITDYAIYMLDPEGVVTSWNPGAERFKGYTEAEILGQNFARFYTDEERGAGAPRRALDTAVSQGHFETEGWRVRKDGTRFWAHVVIDPVLSPKGTLMGFAKITRDLTERRRADAELRQSAEQFRLLVQGVVDYALYMLDRDGNVSNWNAGAQRIKGYLPHEIIGRHFSTFYTETDRLAGLPARGLEAARTQGRWEHEGLRVRKDGSRFWAQVVIDSIRNDQGELIGYAKVTRDITERREAQRALDEARDALFQSQKMDALGRLTGGIAHDFNNLLSAIMGSLDLVRRRLPADLRITPLIDNAIEGARRGAALTERMLAFARKQELKLQAIDVADAVRGVLGVMQRSVGPTVRIETDLPDDLPPARTDPTQLDNALINLAVNARDAMPGGGTLSIALRRDPDRPDSLSLSIGDSGVGMDEETLKKATEPFFTTKEPGKGTGLGLSTVHGLATQSGGALLLRSAPGKGTTVTLRLPISADHIETPAPPDIGPVRERSRRLRILVVDDDNLVLSNTAALLEDLGHRVVSASSGRQALAALQQHPDLDLVITDQLMPQMSGLQLRAAILAERPNLPVLLATGYAELPADAAHIPRLAKPFNQAQLAAAVYEILATAPR